MGIYIFISGFVLVVILYVISFCMIAKKDTPAVQPPQLIPNVRSSNGKTRHC